MARSRFSRNFDQKRCEVCSSVFFVSRSKGLEVDFDYNADSAKYTNPDYLYGAQLRWAHSMLLRRDWHGKRVLELGCFNGFFGDELTRRGADYYGHDLNAKAVKVGESLFNLVGRLFTSFDMVEEKGPFDAIILIDLLEHVDDPAELLEKLRSLLSLDGEVIIAGPLAGRIFYDKTDFPPHHKWRFSLKGLEALALKKNMCVTQVQIQYDAVLLLRNIIGRLIAGFNREYRGESVIAPVGVPRGLLKNFYQGAEKMGAVVFKALRVRYCSGIVKLKFSDKNGPR